MRQIWHPPPSPPYRMHAPWAAHGRAKHACTPASADPLKAPNQTVTPNPTFQLAAHACHPARMRASPLQRPSHTPPAGVPRMHCRSHRPPTSQLPMHVWTNATQPGFIYPEASAGPFGMPDLLGKADIGIALSGGGARAACLSDGWLRSLDEASAFILAWMDCSWFDCL